MSVLLKRITGWMAEAAVYLQRCHVARHQGTDASNASMEGLEIGHDLGSIAQARQALQVIAKIQLRFVQSNHLLSSVGHFLQAGNRCLLWSADL